MTRPMEMMSVSLLLYFVAMWVGVLVIYAFLDISHHKSIRHRCVDDMKAWLFHSGLFATLALWMLVVWGMSI